MEIARGKVTIFDDNIFNLIENAAKRKLLHVIAMLFRNSYQNFVVKKPYRLHRIQLWRLRFYDV